MATAPDLPNQEKTIILYLCEDYRRQNLLDGSPESNKVFNIIQRRMRWANLRNIMMPNQFDEFATDNKDQARAHLMAHEDHFRTYAETINQQESEVPDAPDFYSLLPVELEWALYMAKESLAWVHSQPGEISGGEVIRRWSDWTSMTPLVIYRPAAYFPG